MKKPSPVGSAVRSARSTCFASRRLGARWRVAVALCAVALVVTGCGVGGSGGSSNKNPGFGLGTTKDGQPGVFDKNSTMAAIQQRGKLLVGITFDQKPFAYTDSSTGSPSGLDVLLARRIATSIFGANIEGKVEYIPYVLSDMDTALRGGNIDIAMGRYAITPERKAFIDFAGPYYESYQAVSVSESYSGGANAPKPPQAIADLNGRKVCLVRGISNFDALKELAPKVTADSVMETMADCYTKLSNLQVDAIVADGVDQAQYKLLSGAKYRYLSQTFGRTAYGVGLSKDAVGFRSWLNDQIENWKDYSTAVSSTIGTSVPGNNNAKPKVDRY